MDAIIVVDMQVGLLNGAPKHDLKDVVDRINALTQRVRDGAGQVIWIRHCGEAGDGFERSSPGWAFLPELVRRDEDTVIEKTLNDPYAGTPLAETLQQLAPERVLVTGWATDYCVDATVRSTVSHNHPVVAVSDAHTVSDRPHLSAVEVIRHHNWVWRGLITRQSVQVVTTRDLLAETPAA